MNGYNFIERMRKVLARAREQAAELHHEYVGTEHLLLGMIAEGEGVGMAVFQNLGVDREDLRQLIISMAPTGLEDVTGPDLPYTSPAKKVLEFAMAEARDLNHSYVGTEHLLLGLLAEKKGIAAQVLKARGVTLATARSEIVRLLGAPRREIPRLTNNLPPTRNHGRDGSPNALSYTIEITYDDGTTVRKQCASKREAFNFLMAD